MSRGTRLLLLLTAVGWLGVLLVGGTLYIHWSKSQSHFQELRDRQIETHKSAHQALGNIEQRLAKLAGEQQHTQDLVDQFLEELRIRYTAYDTLLQEKLAPITIAPDPRQYPIEEISFLLQIAQYKQNYLQDPLGTLSAMRQARRILGTMDQVRYHTLMQQLDEALTTLEGYSGQEADRAHRLLTASWLVLSDKISELQAAVAQQNHTSPPDSWGAFWNDLTANFGKHLTVRQGAPQAVETISAYQHVLVLYAVQTELYLARLSLQSHRSDDYAHSIGHALALLADPALDDAYPALRQDLETLRGQHPFPPEIDFALLSHTLSQTQ